MAEETVARRTKTADRYDLFAREYVIDLNGTRAVQAVGIAESGAHVWASRALRKAKVRQIIDGLLSKRASRLEITIERILEKLAQLAFFDVRKLFREDGSLKQITELDEETAAAIAGVEHEKLYEHFAKGNAKNIVTTVKVKLLSRTEALKLLGQYRKLFTEKVEHSADSELLKALAEGRKRVAQQ